MFHMQWFTLLKVLNLEVLFLTKVELYCNMDAHILVQHSDKIRSTSLSKLMNNQV